MKTKLTPRAKELLRTMRDENVLDGILPNLRAVTKFVKKHGIVAEAQIVQQYEAAVGKEANA